LIPITETGWLSLVAAQHQRGLGTGVQRERSSLQAVVLYCSSPPKEPSPCRYLSDMDGDTSLTCFRRLALTTRTFGRWSDSSSHGRISVQAAYKSREHLSALQFLPHTPLNTSTRPFLHARSAFVLSLPLSHSTSRHSMALVALIYVSSGPLGTDFCISPITSPLLQKLAKEDKPSSPSQYADSKWVNGEQAQAGCAHPGPEAEGSFQELQRDAQGEEASLGPVRELRR
jgi:hypothetical protein